MEKMKWDLIAKKTTIMVICWSIKENNSTWLIPRIKKWIAAHRTDNIFFDPVI